MGMPDIERRFSPRGGLATNFLDESQARERGAHFHRAVLAKILLVQGASASAVESVVAGLSAFHFSVRPCSASDTLDQLNRDDWDVVLIDAQGHVDDTLALIRTIRFRYPLALLPVVVLGASSPSDAQTRTLNESANDWMAEPTDAADLGRRLAALTDLGRLRRQ